MKGNNLSNRSAPTLLVRVEDFLVEYKDKNIWDKVANVLIGKENRATLNEDVIAFMFYVFRNTDMTIDLVADEDKVNDDLERLIAELPYSRLIKVTKAVQIAVKLNTGEYLFYVDNDLERISLIGHRRCITLKQIEEQLRGGFTFV